MNLMTEAEREAAAESRRLLAESIRQQDLLRRMSWRYGRDVAADKLFGDCAEAAADLTAWDRCAPRPRK